MSDHQPVLCQEVLELLAIPSGGCVVDATIGLGGHALLMWERIAPDGVLIGLDADEDNLIEAERRLPRTANIRLFHENFEKLDVVLKEVGIDRVDAVLADLGVSSNQLADSERGFSFQQDGPLDMRLDRRSTTTAADLVNRLSETELADVIYDNGQERASRRIARAIHQARRNRRITGTSELSDIVCRALKQDPEDPHLRIHPATRTFMALRISVNRELEALQRLVDLLPGVLKPGGRAAVISFHSLEDGICKTSFRKMKQQGLVDIITGKPVTASDRERSENPRSRSAKLRVIQRTSMD